MAAPRFGISGSVLALLALGLGALPALQAQAGVVAALPLRSALVEATDDHDGDGLADLLVLRSPLNLPVTFEVRSGRDLSLIRSVLAASVSQNPEAPGAVRTVGDLDGDGVGDWILGYPERRATGSMVIGSSIFSTYDTGVVVAQSSVTGNLIWSHRPPSTTQNDPAGYGSLLALLGDVDGDGIEDIATGSQGRERRCIALSLGSGPVPAYQGRLDALSGRTGQILWTAPDNTLGHPYLQGLSPSGDLDGDGLRDLARLEYGRFARSITCFMGPPQGFTSRIFPAITVHSSRTGLPIALTRLPDNLNTGALALVGDLNADGIEDLFAYGGHSFAANDTNQYAAFSGSDLTRLWGESRSGPAVSAVLGRGDLDGNGGADLLIAFSDVPGVSRGGLSWLRGSSGRGVAGRGVLLGQGISQFGRWLAPLGDANGDGDSDYAVSAAESLLLLDEGALPLEEVRLAGPDAAPGLPALRVASDDALAPAQYATLLRVTGALPGERVSLHLGRPLATPRLFPSLHPWWLDLSAPITSLVTSPASAGGQASTRIIIPAAPSLFGLEVALQASATQPTRLSAQALILTLGF